MPIESVYKALGFKEEWEKIEDPEKLHEEFSKEYIHRDLVQKDQGIVDAITGRRMGAFETKLKGFVPEGFDSEALKDKKAEEKAEAIILHYKTQAEQKELALKEATEGKVDEKKVAALKEELEQWKGKATTWEKQHGELSKERDALKTETEGKLKDFKLQAKMKDVMGKIPFADNVNELTRTGFEAAVKSKYKFDLNEKDELEVFDATTGQPVTRDKNAGIMTPEEALKALAVEHKIYRMHGGAPTRKSGLPPVDDKKTNRQLAYNPVRDKFKS